MKKIFQLFFVALVSLSLTSCGYNAMVEKREQVESQWSQVENVYQRRADLIPNLVNTVKGYASHEAQTLQNVIEARAKATSVNLSVDELTPENLQKFEQAQGQLSSALSRLLAVAESYPNLKANENFLALQSQLEGTENRITVVRRKFNETVRDYNTYIQKVPQNMVAGFFDFEKKAYFEAKQGAENAPEVKF